MRVATIADAGVPRGTVLIAAGIAAMLLAATLGAIGLQSVPGPVVGAFVPICATLWCAGDILTAFLLFAHFRVTGRIAFLVLACAYFATGLLSIGYLAAFPGIFFQRGEVQQVSLWLWVLWHAAFPIVVALYLWIDPELLARQIDERRIERTGWLWMGVLVIVVSGTIVAIWLGNDRLPHLIENRTFAPAYRNVVAPVVCLLALAGCASIWARARRPSALHVWLSLALFVMALDSALNALSVARYGVAWYVGKFETLLMATLLLAVLLQEIVVLYQRISSSAMNDALTGMRNRRSFDDTAPWLLALSRRRRLPVAALMIDIDFFKRLNDEHGHPMGDRSLQRVAGILRRELARSSDLVARYGGDEFAALVIDVDREGAQAVAERLRLSCAASLGQEVPSVTVSIGIAWRAVAAEGATPQELLSEADRALYEAKSRGRNCSVLSEGP